MADTQSDYLFDKIQSVEPCNPVAADIAKRFSENGYEVKFKDGFPIIRTPQTQEKKRQLLELATSVGVGLTIVEEGAYIEPP
jgi:hypothetical protein